MGCNDRAKLELFSKCAPLSRNDSIQNKNRTGPGGTGNSCLKQLARMPNLWKARTMEASTWRSRGISARATTIRISNPTITKVIQPIEDTRHRFCPYTLRPSNNIISSKLIQNMVSMLKHALTNKRQRSLQIATTICANASYSTSFTSDHKSFRRLQLKTSPLTRWQATAMQSNQPFNSCLIQ